MSSHFINRRRTGPGQGGAQQARKKNFVLTSAAFRQALAKSCQRLARHGREFAVLALDILEYEEVLRSCGEQAADQLSRMALNVCLNSARSADRVCSPKPGCFLIALPDSTVEGAVQASDRLSALIASMRCHYKHKQLRASCSARVAHCSAFSGDAEAMLASLGFFIDEKGELTTSSTASAPLAPAQTKTALIRSAFSAWLARYDNLQPAGQANLGESLKLSKRTGVDVWSGGRQVGLRLIEQRDGAVFDAATLETALRRARVLQSVDHPGVAPLLDFGVQDEKVIYLVNGAVTLPKLSSYLDSSLDSSPDSDVVQAADWAVQISNSLIYLQSLMPPVVPAVLSADLFLVDSLNHLVLFEYDLPYLLPGFLQTTAVTEQEMQAVSQGRAVPAYEPIICSLASMISAILKKSRSGKERLQALFHRLQDGAGIPPELNTIFKIRSAVKEIIERDKLTHDRA